MNESDDNLLDFEAAKLAAEDKEETDKKGKKKKSASVETLWHRELMRKGDMAIELDADGAPIVYSWQHDHWVPAGLKIALEGAVTKFLVGIKKFSKYNMSACASSTEPLLYAFGRRLKREKKRFLISTKRHMLEVLPSGKIIVLEHDKNILVRTHVDIHLDVDKMKDGYYYPTDNETIEGRGMFGKLIRDTFPMMDTRRGYQEFFGDSLNPTLRKAMALLIGAKNSGKSQVLECAMGLHSNSYGGDLAQLSGFDTAGYVGRSLVVIDEIGKKINELQFKRMVGGAVMPIARKYQTTLSIKPDWKFLGGANTMPRFADRSGAQEERIYPFVVNHHKGEKIDGIGDKIINGYFDEKSKTPLWVESQLSDVLDWALNGAVEVCKRGRTLNHNELPKESIEVKQQMEMDTNPCRQRIKQVEVKPTGERGGLVPKQEVYRAFCQWSALRGKEWIAGMDMNVWVRDLFRPAMIEAFGEDCFQGERRALQEIIGKGKVRVECFPVKFMNLLDVEVINLHEAVASYDREDSWDEKDMPEHVLRQVRRRIQAEEDIRKLTQEQLLQKEIAGMIEKGYKRVNDPLWGYIYEKEAI